MVECSDLFIGMDVSKALAGLDDLELSPETRALFLGGNARRVYGIGA